MALKSKLVNLQAMFDNHLEEFDFPRPSSGDHTAGYNSLRRITDNSYAHDDEALLIPDNPFPGISLH